MSITIENMLKIERFADLRVIAGHEGLQREITSVSVMEAPDMYKWLKGGEFFITTGYCVKDELNKLGDLIQSIENSGASAFGIKLNRFIEVLPKDVIERANRLAFPIIQIPIDFTFIDIINPILTAIINEQSKKLQHSVNIHKAFTQLVIEGGGIQQIIDTLSEILKYDVAFFDTHEDRIYKKPNSDWFTDDNSSLRLDEILLNYAHYPLKIDKDLYGYIITSNAAEKKDDMVKYDEIAIENASTILKLEIQKRISYKKIEEGYRSEFVRDLVVNNIKTIEEVKNRAKLYGWDLSTGLVSIIVDIDNFKIQYLKVADKQLNETLESTKLKIFDTAIKVLKKYFDQVVYTMFNDKLVLLINFPDKHSEKHREIYFRRLREICEEIRLNILKMNSFTVTIGVGNYEASVMNVYKSYECAQKSVDFGRIRHKGNKVVFYDELGVEKLLSLVYKSDEAKEFYLSYLQRLIEYDNKNNTDLLDTLRYIVRNNWNLKAASKEMYLHYNTIKYRFNMIKTIMDIDINDFNQEVNIDISLKLMEMVE